VDNECDRTPIEIPVIKGTNSDPSTDRIGRDQASG
jgi:hypothetical protein